MQCLLNFAVVNKIVELKVLENFEVRSKQNSSYFKSYFESLQLKF